MNPVILLIFLSIWSFPVESTPLSNITTGTRRGTGLSSLVSRTARSSAISLAVDDVQDIKRFFRTGNFGIGVYARTASLNAVSRSIQGDDDWKVKEQLNQVMTTLYALDVMGGGIAPVVEHLLDVILTSREMENTRNLWKGLNEHWKGSLKGAILGQMTYTEFVAETHVKKTEIFTEFEKGLRKFNPNSRQLKYINRAKKWFRLKTAAQAIGPLFDTISIGVNSWALHTAIRDCNAEPKKCNYGAMASAGLGIAAGGVGIATFFAAISSVSAPFGPAGAILAACLTITATLIELFYRPSEEWVKEYNSQVKMMKGLIIYSRSQLYHANEILARNSIYNQDTADIYVVNQGHLPKWNLVHRMERVSFGLHDSNNPRKEIMLFGRCNHPILDSSQLPGGGHPANGKFCPYLVDGQQVEGSAREENLGYGFYGFTRSAKTTTPGNFPNSEPYSGSIVLIPTDKVQESVLTEEPSENLDAKLRGLLFTLLTGLLQCGENQRQMCAG